MRAFLYFLARLLGDLSAAAESRINVGYAYYFLGQYDNALLNLSRARELYEQNSD